MHHAPPIQYWNELRSSLRRRHIPFFYERELMDKLQRLQQKNLSVEEYRQQMKLFMLRVGIKEEERTIIFRFQRKGHIASQCPTNKTMILRGNDIYSSNSTSSSYEEEVIDSSEEISPCEGNLLVARRLLANPPHEQNQSQRDNLFHSRCNILENTCSLIVDSGSYNNFCSSRLVNKLNLTSIAHPKAYKLQWLNEGGPLEVK
uniref:Retrotransposon gag domain-containing protein n=1 Tax=Cajanus cajan TaxID=3821 RepID=A0A151QWF6_CAJCA|nr:hypothetical protein KK1_044449 [Cajanus cajan]